MHSQVLNKCCFFVQMQAQAQSNAQVQAQAQAQAQMQAQAQAQARQQQVQQQAQQQALMQSAMQQQFLQLQQQQGLGQQFPSSQVPPLLSPSSSLNSVPGMSPFQTPRDHPLMNGNAAHVQATGFPSAMTVQTENVGGVPKKVYKIKTQFEGRTEHKSFQPEENGQVINNNTNYRLMDHKTESEAHQTRMLNQNVIQPPPPSFQDQPLSTPRMVQAPLPPPPPPVQDFQQDTFDRENGTFTFTDKKGRARTVRIGRVVWPPPASQEAKGNREVGRLEIDENVARTIGDQHGAKKIMKKIEAPPPEKRVSLEL